MKIECPLCKGKGFETIWNEKTEQEENQDCTLCWGDCYIEKLKRKNKK